MKKIVKNLSELSFNPRQLESMPTAQKVMMVDPAYFDVEYAINPHMLDHYGKLNRVDKNRARQQWESVKHAYEKINFNVYVVQPEQSLPDMVFCANQSFPYLTKNGEPNAILSNMHSDIRHKEVAFISKFLQSHNYKTHSLLDRTQGSFFESMGDALWYPGRRFILGGYGFRTDLSIYDELAKKLDVPIAVFKLTHDKFYHLDTCLSVLNEQTAIACKEAFDESGWTLLKAIFPQIIEAPLSESDAPGFVCNAHCPDGKHVIMQAGSAKTKTALEKAGFVPIEVETSEFIKSGGSVFCMKLMFF